MNIYTLSVIMISLIPFSKGSQNDEEDDFRNYTLEQYLNVFENQTFYGYKTNNNTLKFNFPNLYKNRPIFEFYYDINISLHCFTNDFKFSKEINASYLLFKFNDTDEQFSTEPRYFQDCLIEQTHKNYKVEYLNFALSFKLSEYNIEIFRAMYSEIIYTNTEGCAWSDELMYSQFMKCDYNCLMQQLKPFPNPSSTLKFCKTESCIETVENIDLLEDQDVYLLQDLTSNYSKNFSYGDSFIFLYSEDGFVHHLYNYSPSIYSQGKITHHIKISKAWMNFQFSIIQQIFDHQNSESYYIGGNTNVIECVKDQDLKCIDCESICRMNCGVAPEYCVCENNTCFALNLFNLISIWVFFVFS